MVYIQPMNRSSCDGQANSQDRFDTFMTSLFQLQEISLEIISVKIPFFFIQVRHIGFSTGWGSVGEFKIWRKEDSDDNHNEAFTLGVPQNMVPGSERAAAFMIGKLFSGWMLIYSIYYYYFHHCVIYIWKKTILDHAILKRMELIYSTFCSVSKWSVFVYLALISGDVMGPTLHNLDKLLRLPFGCGEQNMIHFAPNVFVLKYLQKTRQLSPEVENEATDYLLQGKETES